MNATTTPGRKETRSEREDLPLSIGRGPQAIESSLLDVSARGIGFWSREEFKEGELLLFRIELSSGPVCGAARARWTKPHHLGYRCGAEIVRMRWLHRRRLYYLLHPEKEDPLEVLDRALTTGVFLLAALLAMDFLGLSPRRLLALGSLILRIGAGH